MTIIPKIGKKHGKTIVINGSAVKKTFNGDGREVTKPLENHRWQWWPEKNNITIPSLGKNDHRPSLCNSIQQHTLPFNTMQYHIIHAK